MDDENDTPDDYLSIDAECDDGQDLIYIWSYGLPVGKVFRCPIPRGTPMPLQQYSDIPAGSFAVETLKPETHPLMHRYEPSLRTLLER